MCCLERGRRDKSCWIGLGRNTEKRKMPEPYESIWD